MSNQIRTHSGKLVDPLNLRVGDIEISDIAHALANCCRFSGHTRNHFSVASHSLLVSQRLPTPLLQLHGLLHDAAEAYLGDVSSPVKRRTFLKVGNRTIPFRRVERRAMSVIRTALGIPEPLTDDVALISVADEAELEREMKTEFYDEATRAALPSVAAGKFLERFETLKRAALDFSGEKARLVFYGSGRTRVSRMVTDLRHQNGLIQSIAASRLSWALYEEDEPVYAERAAAFGSTKQFKLLTKWEATCS